MSKKLDEEIYQAILKEIRKAYDRAMETTGYVLVIRDGYLVKLYKDGSFERYKKYHNEN